jgi:hypothetical protein
MLSRIERASVLPEELGALPKVIDEKVFAALSGKSEVVKRRFALVLAPYKRAPAGPFALALSGKSIREEEARLGRLARANTPGVAADDRATDDLVRLVVEHRAVRAQRLLTWLLRGWLPPHVAAAAMAAVLLLVHILAVTRGGAR